MIFRCVLIAGVILGVSTTGFALDIGETAPEVALKDIRYLPQTLADFPAEHAQVIYLTTVGCPLAGRYLGRLQKMHEEYRDQGVQFLAINVGPEDTIQEAAYQAIEYEVSFPFLKDTTGAFVTAFGATRTSEVFVLDAGGVLRYHGRVDDQYRLSGVQPKVKRHDLREALDALIAGRPVEVAETTAEGCAITPVEPIRYEGRLTYSEDIAPILNANCVQCHRPEGGAPFSLTDYETAKGFARMIAEVVREERMPPWYAHPAFGTFRNDRRLADDDKIKLIAWATGGARRGNPEVAPVAKDYPTGRWQNGAPDLLIEASKEEVLPADGYIAYRYAALPYVFPRDTYVDGIEISPRNVDVVHHANLIYTVEGTPGFTFLSGKVPGAENADLQEGEAMLIPKGARLVFQIHYVTTGKKETDRIAVGFRYAGGHVKRLLHNVFVDDQTFKIPPGAGGYKVVAKHTLENDITARALFSHMHLRGKDMSFFAHYPDGTNETLLVVPNYSFDWQLAYEYESGVKKFPAGTEFEIVAHFDNSTHNAFNPDATVPVRYGPQTIHEMMIGVMYYTIDDEKLDLTIDPATGGVAGDVVQGD